MCSTQYQHLPENGVGKVTRLPVCESCLYAVDHGYERPETNQLPNYAPVNRKKLQLVIEQQPVNLEYQSSEE